MEVPEQLVLIEGVRIKPPDCFDDVIEAMETVFDAEPSMRKWSVERLARDIREYGQHKKRPKKADIERSIRIYRERNQL